MATASLVAIVGSHGTNKIENSEAQILNNQKMKIRVHTLINNISAERFWDATRPLPPVKISTNLNLISIDKTDEEHLEVPFVFTINYNPAVAQISFKGKTRVSGKKDELDKIHTAYKEKKAPPPIIVQTISNVVFLESVIISRTLNIPPPIPLPKIPVGRASKKGKEPSYRA